MSNSNSPSIDRLALVAALVELKMPISEAARQLSNFPYDFAGEPFAMFGHHLRHALSCFLDGHISSAELKEWAEAIEFRDDMKVHGQSEEEATFVARCLVYIANPELDDQNQIDAANRILSQLDAFGAR